MINKHGVDVSKIQVGDVVYTGDFVEDSPLLTVSSVNGDVINYARNIWYETCEFPIPIDDIEYHYARQPREERG